MSVKEIFGVSGAFFVLIAMVGLILFSDKGFMDMKRLLSVKAAIEGRNVEIDRENKEIERKISRLKEDAEYIENIARQELGMVGKNDVVLTFKEKNAAGKRTLHK